jgi:hypothetical protein
MTSLSELEGGDQNAHNPTWIHTVLPRGRTDGHGMRGARELGCQSCTGASLRLFGKDKVT